LDAFDIRIRRRMESWMIKSQTRCIGESERRQNAKYCIAEKTQIVWELLRHVLRHEVLLRDIT